MLRILLFILAVVASVLALVLEQPELYAVAGTFLIVAGILLVVQKKRNHEKAQETYIRPTPQSSDEELKDLGIIGIRPIVKGGTVRSDDDQAALAGGVEQMQPAGDRETSTVTYPAPGPRIKRKEVQPAPDEESSLARQKKDVILPYLHSLLTAVNANTVCLLRKDEAALRYHIEAIVSKNSYARSQGHFAAREPLMLPAHPSKPVTVIRIGEKGISPQSLGYYLEPIAARQVALVAVPQVSKKESYVLLADTMDEGGLGTQKQLSLLTQFAGLLASVLETQEGDLPGEADEAQNIRPRREIVAEEMEKARSQDSPLGFALVHLRQAEGLSEEGDEVVTEAELLLESALQDSLPGGRVERFGELTFGVFYHQDITRVEQWAVQLQTELDKESGLLEGGVSIGIAMLADRHQSPDAYRADATEALRESYETGGCTIIE